MSRGARRTRREGDGTDVRPWPNHCGPRLAAALLALAVGRGPSAAAQETSPTVDFLPLPDRWRIALGEWPRYADAPPYSAGNEEFPYVADQWWNPYRRNVLKGDLPIVGQEWFLALTATADSLYEKRRLPTPSGVTTSDPGSDPFFGDGDQRFAATTLLLSVELFRGDAAYRPRDLELRLTPAFQRNYLHLEERNGTEIDPREGETRDDSFAGWQELFLEVHLADTSPWYDFVSSRFGVQPFLSDFRGFVFNDNQPGFRLFGNAASNRHQWNLAWFRLVEKDTNSGLVDLADPRRQQVAIANWYVQDCLAPGWTHQWSLHWNRDRGGRHEDDNGFPARPTRLGSAADHELDTVYFGWASEGHAGWLNVSHAVYQVIGRDTLNPLAGRRTRVNAQMAALELSRDFDWLRPKGALFWASGDRDPDDAVAQGFDSIFDAVNFVGGPFSFWNRQGLALTGTPVALVDRLSLLPHLRTSKLHDTANHVNPGLLILNAGLDAKLTQELKLELNASWLRFDHTAPLELALNDDDLAPEIGLDLSVGLNWRPWLTDNVILTAGHAWLLPAEGLRDLYGSGSLHAGFVGVTLTW